MYRSIVKSRLRAAFSTRAEDVDEICAFFADRHRHVFFGQSCLSGVRHSLTETRAWYSRVARLMPDLEFQISSVRVHGWPWKTDAVVEWSNRFVHNGSEYLNSGAHVFVLRWGRVTDLVIYSDTGALDAALEVLARDGEDEANAPPIGQPLPRAA